jgi:hypothetical protein
MQVRSDRQSQMRTSVRPGRRLERRRLWTRSLALVLLLALVLAACLAPVGQARSSGDGSGREAAASQRAAVKEERAAARQALKEAERNARAKLREERANTRRDNAKRDAGIVRFSCNQMTVTYLNFPNLPGNTVTELVTVDKVRHPSSKFTFDGPTGSHAIPILAAPPGSYHIDLQAKWDTNGLKGGIDHLGEVTCSGVAFTIEKLQRIAGTGGSYTTAPLTGHEGQTIEYEIVVKNTGYLPLTFSGFTDAHCGTGTITGGSGSEPVARGDSTKYFCRHMLSTADQAAGSYTNTATDRGSPPAGEGAPITETSNTVTVAVTAAPPEEKTTPPEEKPTPPEEKKASSGEKATSPSSGTLASSSSSPLPSPLTPAPQSGVLPFSARTVPGLKGPQGCVRGSFAASVRSVGVKSVTFYLDGHKLKTLTARNAHKGRLTITIDASKLKVGAHRLLAKITMLPTASIAKSVQASRRMTVVRCSSAVLTPKFTG